MKKKLHNFLLLFFVLFFSMQLYSKNNEVDTNISANYVKHIEAKKMVYDILKQKYKVNSNGKFGEVKGHGSTYNRAGKERSIKYEVILEKDKISSEILFTQETEEKTELKSKTLEINGKKEYYVEYYENEKIFIEEFYENGVPHGTHIKYFWDGDIKRKVTYKNGELDGEFILSAGDTGIVESGVYKNGKREGVVKKLYLSGMLISESLYKNDILEGKYVNYYSNGKISENGCLVNGKKNGIVNSYYENGALFAVHEYKNDILDGSFTSYYKDNIIMERGDYTNGKLSGNYYKYFHDGKIKQNSFFDNDNLSEKYITYYENGNIATDGLRSIDKNPIIIGDSIINDEEGNVIKSIKFINNGNLKFRIDNEKNIYLLGENKKVIEPIYFLMNKFNSEKFILIQDYFYLLVLPIVLIVFMVKKMLFRNIIIKNTVENDFFIKKGLKIDLFDNRYITNYINIIAKNGTFKEKIQLDSSLKNSLIKIMTDNTSDFVIDNMKYNKDISKGKTKNNKNKINLGSGLNIKNIKKKEDELIEMLCSVEVEKIINYCYINNKIKMVKKAKFIFISVIVLIFIVYCGLIIGKFSLSWISNISVGVFLLGILVITTQIVLFVKNKIFIDNLYASSFDEKLSKFNLKFVENRIVDHIVEKNLGDITMFLDAIDSEVAQNFISKNVVLDGLQQFFYKNDVLAYETYYRDGINHGKFNVYNEAGRHLYSVYRENEKYILDINGNLYTEKEMLELVNSINSEDIVKNDKIKLSKDRIIIFYDLMSKLGIDVLFFQKYGNLDNYNVNYINKIILILGMIAFWIFMMFAKNHFTAMPIARF